MLCRVKKMGDLPVSSIFHRNGVALQGYDVVAYYKEHKAVKGLKSNSFYWDNLEWYFSTPDHLALFKSNPHRYLPEYGGYCAFGASEGYKASTRPYAFHIEDGKLYLNFASYVQDRWMEQKDRRVKQADEQWGQTRKTVPVKAHPILIWWKYQLLKVVGRDLFG